MQPVTYEAYKLIHDGILALGRAELQGMRVDMDYCGRKTKFLEKKILHLKDNLEETELVKVWRNRFKQKTNLKSGTQLGEILYKVMKIEKTKMTKGGAGATDESVLNELSEDIPGISVILEIRKLEKIKDTYLASFMREQVNGYMHPFFNLHTVVTFRSSCNSPNFQNIPKRDKEAMKICRQAIYPRPGHQLIEIDFSGLEVMIACCYHKDPTMFKYLTDRNSDMHGDMAAQIFLIDKFDKKKFVGHKYLRDATKNSFVFPQFYGDYYKNNAIGIFKWCKLPQGKLTKSMGIEIEEGLTIGAHLISKGIKSFDDFVQHMKEIEEDFWGRRFKVYAAWKEDWYEGYLQKGYLDTLTGFRCHGEMSRNDAINYPVQGSAFHCLLWSFIQTDKLCYFEGWDSKPIGQIHDALIADIHPGELEYVSKTIHKITTEDLPKAWPWIIVPLEVEADLCEVDKPWSEKQSYKLPEVQHVFV